MGTILNRITTTESLNATPRPTCVKCGLKKTGSFQLDSNFKYVCEDCFEGDLVIRSVSADAEAEAI